VRPSTPPSVTGAQARPTGWRRAQLAAFGVLGWVLFAAGWIWAVGMELPQYWLLVVLAPPFLILCFVVFSLAWVLWNRRATTGGERRRRPEDEQPQTHHDRLGRQLVVDPACRTAAQIEIVLDGKRKLARPRSADG